MISRRSMHASSLFQTLLLFSALAAWDVPASMEEHPKRANVSASSTLGEGATPRFIETSEGLAATTSGFDVGLLPSGSASRHVRHGYAGIAAGARRRARTRAQERSGSRGRGSERRLGRRNAPGWMARAWSSFRAAKT